MSWEKKIKQSEVGDRGYFLLLSKEGKSRIV